jgi:hypothetical protein
MQKGGVFTRLQWPFLINNEVICAGGLVLLIHVRHGGKHLLWSTLCSNIQHASHITQRQNMVQLYVCLFDGV